MAANTIPGMTIPAIGGGAGIMASWIARITSKFTSYKRLIISTKQVASGSTLYLDPKWSGAVIMVENASFTIKLPTIGGQADHAKYEVEPTAGMEFTIVNRQATGNAVTVTADSNSKFSGGVACSAQTTYASPVRATGSGGGSAVNTAATAYQGDYIKVVSDGTDTWQIVSGFGVWAIG